ncbi:hypothetical protein BCR33DRAFT_779370 [Rhizoclosmatium globosum]|uniref:Uncharacterized protein n=1 Tax=Rhizoclosmatium globosum TaxID=329046 RepID=A0A1Y2D1L2_9FUNG|nr:hypothetical protein BCR33DRAFT_779370 [Rhizoclosmatium globosum]|eukprot:ORY53004.1 hypothetical protein BCR33DRAFT_779370 [Rhizoclosmatium globosum]
MLHLRPGETTGVLNCTYCGAATTGSVTPFPYTTTNTSSPLARDTAFGSLATKKWDGSGGGADEWCVDAAGTAAAAAVAAVAAALDTYVKALDKAPVNAPIELSRRTRGGPPSPDVLFTLEVPGTGGLSVRARGGGLLKLVVAESESGDG